MDNEAANKRVEESKQEQLVEKAQTEQAASVNNNEAQCTNGVCQVLWKPRKAA